MAEAIADLWDGARSWRIWALLGYQDIQMRYRRSLIGPFWISISLATLILTLAFLYSKIFQADLQDYLAYLSVGLLTWSYLASLVTEGCGVALESEAHLKNIPLPLTTIAMRVVFRATITFLHNCLAVALLLALFGAPIGWTALVALPGVAVYVAFGLLAGLILGPLCARFRDLPLMIANLLQIVFFLTPIIWMPDQLGGRVALVHGNPLFHLIELVRAPILGRLPDASSWLASLILLALLAIAALLTLPHAKRRLYFWL